MIDWYPIIKGNCNKCGLCLTVCPIQNLYIENKQLQVKNGMACPNNCQNCANICPITSISYYDGTEESLLKAFSGHCKCHEHNSK